MIIFNNIQEVISTGRLTANSLINADCLEAMKYIEDKSIDLILSDPPYGTTACKWDTIIPFEPMWEQYKRIIKDNSAIVLTASQPFTSALVMSNIKMFKYEWIWHKSTSGSFATAKKQPMKYHENILVFYKNSPIYNPQFQSYADSTNKRFKDGEKVNRKKQLINSSNKIQNGLSFEGEQGIMLSRGKYPESVQKINSEPNCNGTKLHPTQKPVALGRYLIRTYTNEGDLILDNTCGSGSFLVAAMLEKRNFIGIELDENYCAIARKRLEDTQKDIDSKLSF